MKRNIEMITNFFYSLSSNLISLLISRKKKAYRNIEDAKLANKDIIKSIEQLYQELLKEQSHLNYYC